MSVNMDISRLLAPRFTIFVMPFFDPEDEFSPLDQIPINLNPRGNGSKFRTRYVRNGAEEETIHDYTNEIKAQAH